MVDLIVHWNFDPIAFTLGPIPIHWYGICWAGAFLQAEYLVRHKFKTMGRSDVDVATLTMFTLFGTVIGARLAHVLFYDPAYYLSHPFKIVALWEGGLASHGGAIGFVLALAWAKRRYAKGVPLMTLLDAAALPAAIGGAIVRVANFLNSEIVGIPTNAAWGVVFEQIDGQPRYPVQLFEAAAYLIIAGGLWLYDQRHDELRQRPGRLAGIFFMAVFSARALIEVWKTPQAVYESGAMGTVGQWLSLPFVLLGIYLYWHAGRCRMRADDSTTMSRPSD